MFQRRITVILLVIIIAFLVLELKLFSLQVIQGSYYRQEAQRRSTRIELISALRGRILDRRGRVLVEDRPSFDLYLIPFYIEKHQESLNELSQLLHLN